MNVELLRFLRARLAEERELALAASPGPWHTNPEEDEVLAADGILVADGFALSGRQLRATTAHIARHDPALVLFEVETKRQLLARFEELVAVGKRQGSVLGGDAGEEYLYVVLPLLALPYADHPDYREEWKP